MLPFAGCQSDLPDQMTQLVVAIALTRVLRHQNRYLTDSRYCSVVLQKLQRLRQWDFLLQVLVAP